MSLKIIKPSKGKLFANSDETELYSALILAPNDSIDNYHEVDELIEIIIDEEPEEETEEEIFDDSEIVIIPDEEGKISYEDALKLTKRISQLTNRIISITESQLTNEQINLATRYEAL